jgi:hypothetical protein
VWRCKLSAVDAFSVGEMHTIRRRRKAN